MTVGDQLVQLVVRDVPAGGDVGVENRIDALVPLERHRLTARSDDPCLHLFEELDDGPEVFYQVPQQIEGGIGAQPPETLSHALQFIDGRFDQGEGSSRPFADRPARIGGKHQHSAGEHEQIVQHLPVGLHQVQGILLA